MIRIFGVPDHASASPISPNSSTASSNSSITKSRPSSSSRFPKDADPALKGKNSLFRIRVSEERPLGQVAEPSPGGREVTIKCGVLGEQFSEVIERGLDGSLKVFQFSISFLIIDLKI